MPSPLWHLLQNGMTAVELIASFGPAGDRSKSFDIDLAGAAESRLCATLAVECALRHLRVRSGCRGDVVDAWSWGLCVCSFADGDRGRRAIFSADPAGRGPRGYCESARGHHQRRFVARRLFCAACSRGVDAGDQRKFCAGLHLRPRHWPGVLRTGLGRDCSGHCQQRRTAFGDHTGWGATESVRDCRSRSRRALAADSRSLLG